MKAPSLTGTSNVLPRSALGPLATVHLPKCPRWTALCSISLLRARKRGRPSSGCDGRPNHNRGWILASTHSPAFHGCIPTPNTVVLMVDALLNVKFLLVREHLNGQHAIFHEVQKMSTSCDPHSFKRGCDLMALLHLVGEGLEVFLKDAAHRSLADASLCGQFGHRTTGICPLLFPCF